MRASASRWALVLYFICWHAAPAMSRDLAEFEGRYEYRDGLTLFTVEIGEQNAWAMRSRRTPIQEKRR